MSEGKLDLITPGWSAPDNVKAFVTTRSGGVSRGPWKSLNLGDHVGDDPGDVARNRDSLLAKTALPSPPIWLKQVHGCDVAQAPAEAAGCIADAAYSDQPQHVCAVLTADCLPILLTDREGKEVAAVHAGWRGLAAGVIEAAIERFMARPDDLIAWLGPAIGPQAFEVGDEVRDCFIQSDAAAQKAFVPRRDRWLADIYLLARQRMTVMGVSAIYGGEYCTFTDAGRFFSYRRDGETGRMATLIWFE